MARLLNLGVVDYREALELQRSIAAAVASGESPDTVLLLEHPPTITLGRRADPEELHVPPGADVEIVETDRGGKSTYHAPGQLVCYPILDLTRHGQDVKRYCRDLEEALIRTTAAFGIEATRIEGLTGIWLERPPRKIASIGIHLSRWISTHGYALNVDLDPAPVHGVDHRLRARRLRLHVDGARARPAGRGRRRPAGGRRGVRRRVRCRLRTGARRGREPLTVDIRACPRPDWEPVPYEGVVGVEGRVLIREDDFFLAQLRFAEHATIHEHPGPNDTIVVCLEGEGMTSVGAETAPLRRASRCAGRAACRTACGPRARDDDPDVRAGRSRLVKAGSVHLARGRGAPRMPSRRSSSAVASSATAIAARSDSRTNPPSVAWRASAISGRQ